MSDRSLDEFARAEAADGDDAEDGDGGSETPDADPDPDPDGPAPATDPASASPATLTMRWSPDGAACDACDESVTRRWRDAERFVCADCKEW